MSFFNSKNIVFSALVLFVACSRPTSPDQDKSVKSVMDEVITRLYKEVPPEQYNTIDDNFILGFLSDDEKHVLATKYQYFHVNVPVTVSLIRNVNQKIVPFWLQDAGFIKTDETVRNDVYEYEVWQKDFDAGLVELGINGFDMHRTVYFICVGPQNPSDDLKITDFFPPQYPIMTMQKGAFTYHDWSDLKITEYPAELEGQALFTTVRGRAREAHTVGAFRETKFPSSEKPDQIMLTWSGDPTNSVNIQWRANLLTESGVAKYWLKGGTDTLETKASTIITEDRMLYNDRHVRRFTAALTQLIDGKEYEYMVGSGEQGVWSNIYNFMTEKKDTDEFSFIWFGDTHRDPLWAEMLHDAYKNHGDISFFSIAGDLVTTGLYHSEWDEFFGYTQDEFAYKPLMPVLGNHDRQDGLGAQTYYEIFALPENGPEKVTPESTYSFKYGNALFLMIDSTHPNEAQTEWIADKLKNTKAVWKFVMFHFPPYNFEEPYFDIQEEWGGIFDTYHVDMVMGGHIHYYMRSKPINGGKVVDSFKDGTVYAVSIGTTGNHDDIGDEPYAEKRYKEGQFYQYMKIDKNVLKYTSYNKEGEIADEFTVIK